MFDEDTIMKKTVSESAESISMTPSFGSDLSSLTTGNLSARSAVSHPPSGQLTMDISSISVSSAASRQSSDQVAASETMTSQR